MTAHDTFIPVSDEELERVAGWGEQEPSYSVRVAQELVKARADIKAGRLVRVPEGGIGELSDGYHTFDELYQHRATLFSIICNCFSGRAWKSKQHDDGSMYEGMFIVGFDTGYGQATYHYDIDPYWNDFLVKELERAPAWDGHTSNSAIIRLYMFGEAKHSEHQ